MKKYFATASLAVSLVLGLSSGAHAQALTPIKISYQPSLYWALPFHVATEKGWWKEVGLAPEFSTFPAGVPQIAASAAGSWDVGGTGSVPAVLGHVRFGIKTIGAADDECNIPALLLPVRQLLRQLHGSEIGAALIQCNQIAPLGQHGFDALALFGHYALGAAA